MYDGLSAEWLMAAHSPGPPPPPTRPLAHRAQMAAGEGAPTPTAVTALSSIQPSSPLPIIPSTPQHRRFSTCIRPESTLQIILVLTSKRRPEQSLRRLGMGNYPMKWHRLFLSRNLTLKSGVGRKMPSDLGDNFAGYVSISLKLINRENYSERDSE